MYDQQLVVNTDLLNHLCNNLINKHKLIRTNRLPCTKALSKSLPTKLLTNAPSFTIRPCMAQVFSLRGRWYLHRLPSATYVFVWLILYIFFDGCSIGWSHTGSGWWGSWTLNINGGFGQPLKDARGGTVVNRELARAVSGHCKPQSTKNNSHPRHYKIVSPVGHSLHCWRLKESANISLYCVMNRQTSTFRSSLIRNISTCMTERWLFSFGYETLNVLTMAEYTCKS